MQLADATVLVHASRADATEHRACRTWLDAVIDGPEAFAVSELVLSSVVRVVTHPRVFRTPTPMRDALEFVAAVREQPHAVLVGPGPRHWSIFTDLCERANARGNVVADAYLAALALEHGCEWITTDRDFTRFPGLRWRDPTAA